MSFRENVADALRIASWRVPRASAAGMTPLTVFGIFAAAVVAVAISEFLVAGASLTRFSPWGLNSAIASAAVQALVIVMFARVDPSSRTIRNLVLLHVDVLAVILVENIVFQALALDDPKTYTSPIMTIPVMLNLPAWMIWFAGGARQAFRMTPGVRRPALRGLVFAIVSIILPLGLPYWPIVASPHFNSNMANIWDLVHRFEHASPDAEGDAEDRATRTRAEMAAARLEARQSVLLNAAVDALEPRDPTATNVFAIGVAGGDQDVFMRETQQSLDILASHFHLGTRVLSLVNNTATAEERPMASMQNLGTALRGVGARMNPDKDVLILTMTSHGSRDGFALMYGDFVERTLDPQTLKTLLDEAGIRNRVVIVSSCYSGAFVAPLADADTVVITAASSTHTSFGCASERKWTYFGEALFEKGLTGNATLAEAFASAKATVAAWEIEQKFIPSDPQIAIGDRIARRFPDLVGAAPSTPAVAADVESAHASRD